MYMYKIYRSVVQIFILIAASCTSFVHVEDPNNQVTGNRVFTNDATAMTALNGLYSELMATPMSILNGGLSIYCGLSADELYNRVSTDVRDEIRTNELQSTNSEIEYRLWRDAYRYLYQANIIIENTDEGNLLLTDNVRSRLHGEALFCRAILYHYLAELFGPVPLVVSTSYDVNARLGREPIEVIYRQIEADLLESAQLLGDYPTEARTSPNRYAAYALLARIYLYRQQWEKAVTYADLVIAHTVQYRIEASLDDVFRPTSKEVIWQLYPANRSFYSPTEAQYYVPTSSASGRPSFPLHDACLERFEQNDNRFTQWTSSKTYLDVNYPYSFKYKVRTSTGSPEEYNVVLRLAEQYFIRSEAREALGDLEGAMSDLNALRIRGGLKGLTLATGKAFRDALIQEKAIEYIAELGHRWLDLKRWGIAGEVLSEIPGKVWEDGDALYPIPQSELKLNPFLIQNVGYE